MALDAQGNPVNDGAPPMRGMVRIFAKGRTYDVPAQDAEEISAALNGQPMPPRGGGLAAAAGIAWTIANVFAALSLNEVAKDIRQDRRDLRDAQVRFAAALKTTPNLGGAAELAQLFANCCDLQADIDRKQTEAISTGVDLALISAGAGGLMIMAGGQAMSWDSFTSGRGLNLGEVVIAGGLTAWAVNIFMDDDDDRSRRRRRGRGVLASLG